MTLPPTVPRVRLSISPVLVLFFDLWIVVTDVTATVYWDVGEVYRAHRFCRLDEFDEFGCIRLFPFFHSGAFEGIAVC